MAKGTKFEVTVIAAKTLILAKHYVKYFTCIISFNLTKPLCEVGSIY